MRKLAWLIAGLGVLGISVASCGGSNADGGGGPDGGATAPGAGDDTDGGGTGPHFGGDGGNTPVDAAILCDEACPNGLVCDHGLCEPPQKQCTTNQDCEYDSYCDPSGQCVPYGAPGGPTNDPSCKLTSPPGVFAPAVFCDFKPAANDPFPAFVDVQATPIVVDFDGVGKGTPSMVVPFTVPVANSYTENMGILRILSGKDCSLTQALGSGQVVPDYLVSSSPVAVGDLDGDGVAEIVAYAADGSTIAFTRKAGTWKALWPTTKATTDGTTVFVSAILAGWAGPSIHDIDDDGQPEIIREGYVINGQTGVLKSPLPAGYASYSQGIPAVIADLDSNGKAELVNGAGIWAWDTTQKAWVADTTWPTTTSTPGWTAVADFNAYDGLKKPEIVNVQGGTVTIYGRDQTIFMGMTAVPVPGGGGGPPTVADYDGDGLPEVGLAGADFYTVFDPDCQTTPRTGGKCGTSGTQACDTEDPSTRTKNGTQACPTYVLWSKKTQDHSSNITGSSVFDFAADGQPEVVYADECFARVYDGSKGDVLFSQYHSSCTWLENPVVADVDGDYRAELVVMSNTACGPVGVGLACGDLDANGVDQSFVGERCLANQDCVSGVCDQGYCRCSTSADCCAAKVDATCIEQGVQCAPPPAGTPGTGNTCRAPHPHGVQGIRVYKDAKNRWVRSRMIWNQHAYAVTNTNEDGTIPRTSKWAENWEDKTLNDFRQNSPGEADGTAIGDVTAQASPVYTCTAGAATMSIPICNRGTAPVGAGIPVGFYAPGGADGGLQKVCSTQTQGSLAVGACETVSCTWSAPPTLDGSAVNVTVVANDGGGTAECDGSNDVGEVEHVFCAGTK